MIKTTPFRRTILACGALAVFIVSACTRQIQETAPVITEISLPIVSPTSVSVTKIPLPKTETIPTIHSPSKTPKPHSTRTPTHTTMVSISATPTPTFDVQTVQTRTPAPTAVCPPKDPAVVRPDISPDEYDVSQGEEIEAAILEYLNQGGSPQDLLAYFRLEMWEPNKHVTMKDLTGDGVQELILAGEYGLLVFTCSNSQYVLIPSDYSIDPANHRLEILAIRDLNLDGIPEIVTVDNICTAECGSDIFVLEWDNRKLASVVCAGMLSGECSPTLWSSVFPEVTFKDIDRNGTVEFSVSDEGPVGVDYPSAVPIRVRTSIYMWNGTAFMRFSDEITPPEYRFQAVQDGDSASLAGDYEKAQDFYQQAIFSDRLEWWSAQRKQNLIDRYEAMNSSDPTPTLPAPDPAEYSNLAAYARYRLLLLHVLRGYMKEARIVFETLQAKYPPGQDGNAYTQMATAFWDEYQRTVDIGPACEKAIVFATQHSEEILYYLGNGLSGHDYFGWDSLYYEPKDICPFR